MAVRVRDVHERVFHAPAGPVGEFINRLATRHALWPTDRWPPIRCDRPLEVAARCEFGALRFAVESYVPRRTVSFRIVSSALFSGRHGFAVEELTATSARLRHVLELELRGPAWLLWPLVVRPLHDALHEDILDRVQAHLESRPVRPRAWSPWVRALRWALARPRGSTGGRA